MKIIDVWVEHPVQKLNQTFCYFSYAKNIMPGTRVEIPFKFQKIVGFVDSISETDETPEEASKRLGFELKEIKSVIDQESLITDELRKLSQWMSDTTLATRISCFQAMLPPQIKPVSNHHKILLKEYAVITNKEVSLTPRQLEIYQYIAHSQPVLCTEVRKKSSGIFRKLLELGAIEIIYKEKEAEENKVAQPDVALSLTFEQKAVIDEVNQSDDQIFLLKGVTGSGKTEVYLQLADQALQKGKQVLFLVPEIALTPQMIARVSRRFQTGLAIYHSALSPQEKYEQYKKVANGKARIVVGTRSAVFLPFENLGLIVMDEEHDDSYKQDVQPSYHCRDVAIWRTEYHHCKLIMGSATPGLDSYARALKKIYHLLEMKYRVNHQLPKIELIPMKQAIRKGESYILSNRLRDKISEHLNKDRQIILLLNRRGYHTQLRCRECRETLLCPHCDLAMSYHHDEKMLKCHNCGTVMHIPNRCGSCGNSKGFSNYGFGTQRLEEEVKQLFPQARILRMDRDTTTRKNSHQKILEEFGKHNADILLGTQMIAKGLDYPNVTLVGILNGDEGVARSDYRSCELTYHLLAQASGRSGRAATEGEVLIQVFDPNHYAIQCAAHHDYDTFFKYEMQFRHAGQYPPYTYMISLTVSSRNESAGQKKALWIKEQLYGNFKVIGVIQLLKLFDQYRFRILLKGKNLDAMRMAVKKLLQMEEFKKIQDIRIDVNPLMLD